MDQQHFSFFYEISNRKEQIWKRNEKPKENLIRELNNQNKIMTLNSKEKIVFKTHYKLYNGYLLSTNKYINLENLKLKRFIEKESSYYGLEISTNQEVLYLYGNKHTIDEWYQYIRIYTIQEDFRINFDFIKLIGKGAHAKVYKVFSKRDNQIYAVKVFKKKNIQNKLGLFKEIEILRKVHHKNIIQFYETYENLQHIYLVFEYLNGGELFNTISSKQTYSEQTVKELIQNILNALDYIHQQNIMHRDLKPQNLLLRNNNNLSDVVIADFGLSDYFTEQCKYLFQKCGTIGYIAPEILRNEFYDLKVDVFSVGVIMFILLADKSPFNGNNTKEVIKNNYYCKINFKLLDQTYISTYGYEFLQLILEQNAKLRPNVKEALQHDWFMLPKMETQGFFRLSLQNIPIFSVKKKTDIDGLIQQSPLWNGSKYSISDSSKSKNASECLSIMNDVMDHVNEEETQYAETDRKISIDETLEEMIDDDFYSLIHSPASLLQIYHLSIKGGRL